VTTDHDGAECAPLPAPKRTNRRRRGHAALGSRVVVGGLALSGTLGMAGVMARRPSVIVVAPVRDAVPAVVVSPTSRTTPAAVRLVPAAVIARRATAAATPTRLASGAPPAVTPAPAPAPAPVYASAPAPAPAPPPLPVVTVTAAPPVATSHASPPPS
jgi:hypothetical protein